LPLSLPPRSCCGRWNVATGRSLLDGVHRYATLSKWDILGAAVAHIRSRESVCCSRQDLGNEKCQSWCRCLLSVAWAVLKSAVASSSEGPGGTWLDEPRCENFLGGAVLESQTIAMGE